MEFRSTRRFVRTAPDKLRILTSMLKGKPYDWAIAQLMFADKDAARPMSLTLKQVKAQAVDAGVNPETLTVKEIRIDEGPKLKRRRILHRGRSSMVLKRMSHITVALASVAPEKPVKKEVAKTVKRSSRES